MKHPIDESMANLAHSQNILDHLNSNPQTTQQPQQTAQPSPEMAPQPQPQPAPTPAPQPTPQPPQEPASVNIEGVGQKIMSAFSEITDFFKQSEQKNEEQVKTLEEKHTQELQGIKDTIQKVIES